MRYNGKITDWNDDRGFGFVTMAGTETRHFMHIRSFEGRSRPIEGNVVTFELKPQDGGRPPAAVAIRPVGQAPVAKAALPTRRFAVDWSIALIQGAALVTALFTARLPGWIALLILAGSLIAFIMYNVDKRRAEQGMSQDRISEARLLRVSLIGWPGALAAQQIFRHKSSKTTFYVPFRLIGLAKALVLGWFAAGRGLPF